MGEEILHNNKFMDELEDLFVEWRIYFLYFFSFFFHLLWKYGRIA